MINILKKHLSAIRQGAASQAGEEKPARKKREELDFLPAYLEIMERPPSNVARLFVFGILAFCIIALTWSILGKVDIIASSPGQLIIGQRSKTIQAPENGEVRKIMVRDGQRVSEGDVLIELNPTTAEAEIRRLVQQISHSSLEVARLNALTLTDPVKAFVPPENADPVRVTAARAYLESEYLQAQAEHHTFLSQLRENRASRQATERMVTSTQSLLNNVTERYQRFERLAEKGNYPKLQLLEQEKEMLEQQRELDDQLNNLDKLKSQEGTLRAQMQQKQAEWQRSIRERLDEQNRSLIDYQQELVKAMERSRLQRILAPVSGIIQELSVHTLGGVVTPGQELMVIVPEDAKLEGDIKVLNKDSGFVRPGQLVEVKVDSFPYTKYGTIKGRVLHISQDSAEDEELGPIFPARVALDQSFVMVKGEPVPLTAGMRLTAEIKTGDRRIIDFLLSPLEDYASTAIDVR